MYFFYSNFNKNISHNSNQLLIYKGIPIYYFDVLVYPNGLFRLVDKKKSFNQRDQQSILNLAENIIVIGSGSNGSGGQGFPKKEAVQFLYHSRTNKGVQLVVMANDEACKTFNRLKTENKRPLLIVHNN